MSLKLGDIVSIVVALAVVAGNVVLTQGAYANGEPIVRVQYGEEMFLYPLGDDRIVELDGPPGVCRIRIAEGRAWVEYSECRDNICILMGDISRPGDWVACLPHGMVLSIEGGPLDGDYDVRTF